MSDITKKFLIIDGNALVHRAYHALPPLKTKKGELVNAVYGFCLLFLKALKEIEPEYIVATFDLKGPTFRHKAYKEYKAKRVKAPQELYDQLEGVKKILRAFSIPIFERAGFEADDLIATIVKHSLRKQALPKVENIILTGDMDALQLVSDQTKVYTMRKGFKDTVLYGPEEVEDKYGGLLPEQLTDYRALRGDPSDNIPGVTGIGEKTAISLLNEFKSLENIYSEIDQNSFKTERIKKPVLEKLVKYKEQAFISQELATLNNNVDIDFKLKDARAEDYDRAKVINTFNDFEFYTLLNKFFNKAPQSVKQVGLFGEKIAQEPVKNNTGQEIDDLAKQNILSPKLVKVEKALIKVVEQMEENGIKVDIKALNKLSDKLGKKITTIEKQVYKLAKVEFNLNSPSQVADILFDKLKISTVGIKRTPGGAISTGVSELKKLKKEHKIVGLILEYRELFKLKSGFVDALPKSINSQDGRIHPNFHQLGTETGRMSCSSPNLQNVPTKGEMGQEVRKAFVAEKGFEFLSLDYSQIDLRVAASLSQDKKMLQFFKQGKDIHRMTASAIFKIKEDAVTKEQRKIAKTQNFGILYGLGSYGFAQRTGLPINEAKEFIKRYFENFAGLTKYINKLIKQTKETGFVETLFGRKRFLPEINSRDHRLRSQAERMARNFPVQGTSADIIKIAMARIAMERVTDKDCRLLLQIHDELLFEVKKNKTKGKAKKIKTIMEKSTDIGVDLIVEASTGTNWGEMVKLN